MKYTVLAILFTLVGCEQKRDPATQSPPVAQKAPGSTPAAVDPALDKQAKALAKQIIIVDGHVDIPYRLNESKDKDGALTEDISQSTEDGDFDYPRAKQGGLDAPFMSIYIPAAYQTEGGAKKLADGLIDMVYGFAEKWPDKFALARSPEEVRANFSKGLVSLPMGIENGAALEDELKNVKHFQERGVRYITLTHSKDNLICDSSYDTTGTHGGLSEFGKKVVAEMNRVGIMVDISHVSDNTFYDVLDATKVPVIASHSSMRHYTTDFERNMADEMVTALAENGGVIMINFGSTFVADTPRRYYDKYNAARRHHQWKNKLAKDAPELKDFAKSWKEKHPPAFASVKNVADHIERVIKVAGVDHVGFGSDFDGVGDSLPTGLKDPSDYPNLIRELLARGHSPTDIEKMASGNVFRVWQAVLDHADGQP